MLAANLCKSVEDGEMSELINALGEGVVWVVGFALPGTLIAVTAIIAHVWRSHRRAEMEIALKQEMIARGMSAEEIVAVVRASSEVAENHESDGEKCCVG
jgi:hypothetical protein